MLSHLEKELERTSAGNPGSGSFSTSVALFDNFYSNSWSRFGQGWRPDVDTGGQGNNGSNSPTMVEEREMRGSIERESEEIRALLGKDTLEHLGDDTPDLFLGDDTLEESFLGDDTHDLLSPGDDTLDLFSRQ